MKLLETILLPIALTNGNRGRSTNHHVIARDREALKVKLLPYKRPEPFAGPVWVIVTRILGKGESKWDYSSGFRGNWKEIEDLLCAPRQTVSKKTGKTRTFGMCNWWQDDSPKFIAACDFRQDQDRRSEGPAIEIRIYKP